MRSNEAILFGEGCHKLNISKAAPAMGYSGAALYRWKRNGYEKMPLVAFCRLCRIQSASDEEILRIIKSTK